MSRAIGVFTGRHAYIEDVLYRVRDGLSTRGLVTDWPSDRRTMNVQVAHNRGVSPRVLTLFLTNFIFMSQL